MERTQIPAGTKWDAIVGYSRAIRVGNIIEVAGTAAVDDDGNVIGNDNPYEQTKFILQKIAKALQACDASFEDVVRTRIFVKDISRWEEIGRAHGDVFGTIKPVTTMVEVSSFIAPELVVEIEVTAIITEKESH
ncbi:MAG: RidA family protein [Ignavibacteriae bacterium]|nr:RidA family protein [Ignavibacteriota bacterium]